MGEFGARDLIELADQAGMRAVNQAVTALAKDPEPPYAFVRGGYRRLRVVITGCRTKWKRRAAA